MGESLWRKALEEIVGRDAVNDASEWCSAWGWEGSPPSVIAYPTSSEQVCEILRLASAERLKIAPAGAGTKQRMGGAASGVDVVLSLALMQRVIDYPHSDLTITVQAGTPLSTLEATVAAQGQSLPLDMPFANRATVGGCMATNSSGARRLAYGTWRDFVLGVQFVTSDGKLAKGGGKVVKNVAGYDLPKLLIGSFGTLAVITEVSLKVFPKPPATATFIAGFADARHGLQASDRILNSPLSPQSMDLIDMDAAALGGEPGTFSSPYNLAIQAAGPDVVLERFRRDLPALLQNEGAESISHCEETAEAGFWRVLQEMTPTFLAAHPDGVVAKASLPLTAMEGFIEAAKSAARSRHASSALLARAGSGIAYCYLWPTEQRGSGSTLVSTCEQLLRSAEHLGGRAIVEWRPVALERKIELWGSMQDDFPSMKRLKAEFDPLGILNPERFYGGI